MVMTYQILKALHIIGFVSWFAGIFYIVRLFVYHAEAASRPEDERRILIPEFELMAWRLWYIITWPAMILTLFFGTWLVWLYGLDLTWVWIKIGLIILLVVYHVHLGAIRKAQAEGRSTWTSKQLRYWNEVATLLLAAIVFVAVLKSALNAAWGMAGLVAFAVLLSMGIKLYRKLRKR